MPLPRLYLWGSLDSKTPWPEVTFVCLLLSWIVSRLPFAWTRVYSLKKANSPLLHNYRFISLPDMLSKINTNFLLDNLNSWAYKRSRESLKKSCHYWPLSLFHLVERSVKNNKILPSLLTAFLPPLSPPFPSSLPLLTVLTQRAGYGLGCIRFIEILNNPLVSQDW